ncbi:MAG: phosphohistidine phosphatase SixA, partial [Chloroflexi bacterium]|nr:phosphohistidine phosphatase SixA [Chloroflexota bacterium]
PTPHRQSSLAYQPRSRNDMRIYFLRHGLAGDRNDWTGDDYDRPLTEEGKERMTRQAATMAKLGLDPDVIVTSPLVRAVQTAEIVARVLKRDDRLVKDDRLGPGFGASELTGILESQPNATSVMLVGHEPGMSETISRLIGGGRVVCKKASLACVEIPHTASLRGELVWLYNAKVMAL